MNDGQQGMNDGYYGMSMREASPTEPNESFVYHSQHGQGEDVIMPLPPLQLATDHTKELLMALFTVEDDDLTNHKAFTTLTARELDAPIDNSCNTALIWAATLARGPLVKALIDRGASIFRVNASDETALMRACLVTNNYERMGFPEILELLGPTIEFRDARGRTVLHHIAVTSAVKGRSQSSKYYLESLLEFVVRQGSMPNSQTSFNLGSSSQRSIGIGRFMSEVVNIQDKSGDTALNIAARINNRSIVSQLMEVGADASIPNKSNLSPMDFGVGDPTDFEARTVEESRGLGKPMDIDVKESSSQIISGEFLLILKCGLF
jgi:ankyrin repeat protein